jgi:hypothetical protein
MFPARSFTISKEDGDMCHAGWVRAAVLVVALAAAAASAPGANASIVTFTGSISYNGAYSGDTLYVAVIDTTQAQDVVFLDLKAYAVGSPPLNQPYSLSFDNATAPAEVIVAALLDVDGGGVDTVGQGDILGWYASAAVPTGVSSATSQSGLDFSLPEAEIEGTVTLAPGQAYAYIIVAQDCGGGGFSRPSVEVTVSGSYAIRGLYAGTWCVFAYGFIPPFTFAGVCYGDPTCANPTPVTLTSTEVKTGVDLDFTAYVPTPNMTWGKLKAKY